MPVLTAVISQPNIQGNYSIAEQMKLLSNENLETIVDNLKNIDEKINE